MNTITTNEAPPATRAVRRPRFQIEAGAESHTVFVELPGIAKEGVRLNLEDGVLILNATRKRTVPEDWKPLHREISGVDYELRLRLNDHVDETRLTAGLADGVLTLTLPVKEAVKPREIAID